MLVPAALGGNDVLPTEDSTAGRSMACEIMKGLGTGVGCLFIPDVVTANIVQRGGKLAVQDRFERFSRHVGIVELLNPDGLRLTEVCCFRGDE